MSKATPLFWNVKGCQRGSCWIINTCGNIRVSCDGVQQGCYCTQQLLWPACVDHKEDEKFPMENCSAGRRVAHYKVLPVGMTPLPPSRLFRIPCVHPTLQHSKDYTSESACFTAEEFQKYGYIFQFFQCFQTSTTTAGVHSFHWNMKIKTSLR